MWSRTAHAAIWSAHLKSSLAKVAVPEQSPPVPTEPWGETRMPPAALSSARKPLVLPAYSPAKEPVPCQ